MFQVKMVGWLVGWLVGWKANGGRVEGVGCFPDSSSRGCKQRMLLHTNSNRYQRCVEAVVGHCDGRRRTTWCRKGSTNEA